MQRDKPSQTALLVSLAVLFKSLDADFRPLTLDTSVALAEKVLRAFVPGGARWRPVLASPLFRPLAQAVEWLALPGFAKHIVCRKAWIHKTVLKLLQARSTLVVVAAGLDGLAAAVSQRLPDARCVEVDHPATQGLKRQLLGPELGERLELVGLDLTQGTLDQALAGQPAPRAVFVLEGLTMYLTDTEVRRLFSSMATLATPDSACVFTFMEPDATGQIRFQREGFGVQRWLKGVSEPFRWGISRHALGAFLQSTGWELQEVAESSAMLPAHASGTAIARGETLAVAVRTAA
jgi:methyltransferase (TIGR00027 family)